MQKGYFSYKILYTGNANNMRQSNNMDIWYEALRDATFCPIGVIKKPKGVQGDLVIAFSEAIDPSRVHLIKALFIEIRNVKVPYLVTKMVCNNQLDTVKFQGINNQNEAYQLKNLSVFIPHILQKTIMLPATPHQHLIGYRVCDTREGILGPIDDVYIMPQQELLVVSFQSKELLIPYHKEIIAKIDDTARVITVQLPTGFLEAVL